MATFDLLFCTKLPFGGQCIWRLTHPHRSRRWWMSQWLAHEMMGPTETTNVVVRAPYRSLPMVYENFQVSSSIAARNAPHGSCRWRARFGPHHAASSLRKDN